MRAENRLALKEEDEAGLRAWESGYSWSDMEKRKGE